MTEEHWTTDFAKSLGVFLNGRGLHAVGSKGEHIIDDSFYVIFNAHHESLDYVLPEVKYGKEWVKVLDTSLDQLADGPSDNKSSKNKEAKPVKAGGTITAGGRSVVLLQHAILHDEAPGERKGKVREVTQHYSLHG